MRRTMALAFLVAICPMAHAVPITFTFSGTGTGTIGSTSFTDSPFLITAQANTSDRTVESYGYATPHTSAQITLGSVGTFAITSSTRTFVNKDQNSAGFSRGGALGLDLYSGIVSTSFGSWNMLTSLGPITSPASLRQWSLTPAVTTSSGVLVFQNAFDIASVFTATVVPEPAAIPLVAIVCIATQFPRRRKSVPHNRVSNERSCPQQLNNSGQRVE
jgi:hypothetical protein